MLLTGVDAYRRSADNEEPAPPRAAAASIADAVPEEGPCALDYARFGGQRAQLIKVVRESVANYVVLEVATRDPLQRSQRIRWLRDAYGDAEHVWLGEFSSADAAMARAVQLCPPARRCRETQAGCGRVVPLLTPIQVFLGR